MKDKALKHSCSHLMASAVKELFPNVQFAIGPAIEEGFYYDFGNVEIKKEDLPKIEKKMKEIAKKNLKFERVEYSVKDARKMLKEQPYKLEILKGIDGKIIFYKHGNFIDLCEGPHVKSTKEIQHFKLMKLAGAYWRGDSDKQMLTRIYGVVFNTKEELNVYLKRLEEAVKRDHRKIGKELDLFSLHEEGPGLPFFHPKGMIIWDELLKFWKEEHDKAGYVELKTPVILSKKLWETSGHWKLYKEEMFTTEVEGKEYALKPMNCPAAMLWYRSKLHSYKELPLRVGEIGLVHRNELSGVVSGLFRVRAFHQDDAHIFMTEDQIKDEVLGVIKLSEKFYKQFGLDFCLELSTRPVKSIGTDEQWEKTTEGLKKALDAYGKDYKINEGDGAFYGPKIDFHLMDTLGRMWQCGTIQLDMSLPERFNLTYEGEDGRKHRPVMIHRTIYGSMERFLGILIEHYAGRFPLWLCPVQVKLMTVTDKNVNFAKKVYDKLKEEGIRVELDVRNETIPKKVRDGQIEKIPYLVTIGDKEVDKKTLAVRLKDGKLRFGVKVDDFIKELKEEIELKD